MTYQEWLDIIENLKSTNVNYVLLEKLRKEPLNSNLSEMLSNKLDDLINKRFELSVNKLIKDLDFIFDDINYLDLSLINFKKEIQYLIELISINQISVDMRQKHIKSIKDGVMQVYEILIREANKYDYTGSYALIIKNNMIKWSD